MMKNNLVCVAENMNMENYEKVEEFYLDYLEDRETDVTIYIEIKCCKLLQ